MVILVKTHAKNHKEFLISTYKGVSNNEFCTVSYKLSHPL